MATSGVARLSAVVLEARDPDQLGRFYAELTGMKMEYDGPDWVTLTGPNRATLCVQRAPGHVAPRWPDPESPMQVHLDLDVDDLDQAEEVALRLGATKAVHQTGKTFRVFLDPAGHPFCLCTA